MSSKGRFKSKATNILKQKPTSMEDFLSDGGQAFNPQEVQGAVRRPVKKEEVERLHSRISKDINDKLLDMVAERKKDKGLSRLKASKRGIIEEALTDFFKKCGR